jgi:hypothetical protein
MRLANFESRMAHLPYLEDPLVVAALIGDALKNGAPVVRQRET